MFSARRKEKQPHQQKASWGLREFRRNIVNALKRTGIENEGNAQLSPHKEITAFDLMSDGLCGKDG